MPYDKTKTFDRAESEVAKARAVERRATMKPYKENYYNPDNKGEYNLRFKNWSLAKKGYDDAVAAYAKRGQPKPDAGDASDEAIRNEVDPGYIKTPKKRKKQR